MAAVITSLPIAFGCDSCVLARQLNIYNIIAWVTLEGYLVSGLCTYSESQAELRQVKYSTLVQYLYCPPTHGQLYMHIWTTETIPLITETTLFADLRQFLNSASV